MDSLFVAVVFAVSLWGVNAQLRLHLYWREMNRRFKRCESWADLYELHEMRERTKKTWDKKFWVWPMSIERLFE